MSERAKEVARQLWAKYLLAPVRCPPSFMVEILESLPEFQEDKWVKWAPNQKLLESNAEVWITDGKKVISAVLGKGGFENLGGPATHYMPRRVPAPPKEEDSELVKKLRSELKTLSAANVKEAFVEAAIEIVKRHEKSNGKA